MGACGCGELNIIRCFKIADVYIAINRYNGCEYCHVGPGVDLCFFDKKGYDTFADDVKVEAVHADEFGGNANNCPTALMVCNPDKMRETADRIEAKGGPMQEYESLNDLLSDYGLELMRGTVEFMK